MIDTANSMTLRAATAADQALIRRWVRGAHLNPLRLAWTNFLIAEQIKTIASGDSSGLGAASPAAQIMGIGQLRPHGDGTVELASLVVAPAARGQGVGSRLVNALIAKADRPLYLMCGSDKVPYYQRFGFVQLQQRREMPRSLRPMHRLATLLTPIVALFQQDPSRIAIMAHRSER